LIHVQRLPDELETLVRDLWALRLQKLQTRVSYESETDTEGQSQLFSSQSEAETTDTEATRRSRRRKDGRTSGTPSILEIVALDYVGVLLLREPVTVADIYSWVNNGELLYYRAAKEVPLGMRERLPGTYQHLLEPNILKQPQKLHQAVVDQLSILSTGFGMVVPSINIPLVLYKWLRQLALPIELFSATQRLALILEIDFSFTPSAISDSNVALRYPEPRLMAILVMATKLLFPMDDTERHSSVATDLNALSMDWEVWSKQQSRGRDENKDERPMGFDETLALSEQDVLSLSDDKLDQYLDWYESHMASEDIRERGRAGKDADFRRTLSRLFPLSGAQAGSKDSPDELRESEARTNRLRQTQGALRPKTIVRLGEDDGERACYGYRRFRSVAELEHVSRLFYDRAAELAGLSIEAMIRAVFAIELKMQKVEERRRRGNDE